MEDIIVIKNSVAGGVWLMAWLFTIGFLRLSFWSGVLALLVWPYHLGKDIRQRLIKNS